MSGQDENVAAELRKINQSLGGLVASQKAHGRELADIKARVTLTNGRVTSLEAANIAENAVNQDRAKRNEIIGRRSTDLNVHKARMQDRFIGSAVAIVAVVVGAVLADVTWF